ncbi:MAG: NADH-quinone oxidoreductase subunit NuoB [Ardenticatenaceae bacterium]|nr:NADH-quinone oxidoreductase subunit NuoB [Ardenticatenaceae bacterium]
MNQREHFWLTIMDRIKTWARVNSPWVIHFNSGSCNGCDIEILATITPRHDLERLASSCGARAMPTYCSYRPVTRQARDRLQRIYAQMPEPKFVVAVGSCALSGGAFQNCYNTLGGVDQVIPVDAYIPGCPPRPEAIIDGVIKLLSSLQGVEPSLPDHNGRTSRSQNEEVVNP